VSSLVSVAHASALCFIFLCVALPHAINHKSRLCAAFCLLGAIGFFGNFYISIKIIIIIISVLMSPLLGHWHSLWITHKESRP
jgi:hypothetical protein